MPNIFLHFCQAFILTIVKLFTVFTYELYSVNTYSALGIPVIIKWVEHKEADGIFISIFCLPAKSLHLCLTLCNPMDCSPSGSSIHGILRQECWSELSCPPPGDQTRISCGCCIAGGFFTVELPGKLPVP